MSDVKGVDLITDDKRKNDPRFFELLGIEFAMCALSLVINYQDC